ncbi:EthD domain-containing protein [Glaciihabitans sp. dw_435]|uniref:EthD domain-containing protein n=1 Tax=Glaciihabitans sp. dw_435 TaxID=2720081 RepID=UPI001BD6103D|nr:EthD domain-containing protein [Glaciihabitans sp. dw_435]
MIKFTILIRRRPDLTREEFITYHREQHAPLFMSVPAVRDNVRRYVQQHALDVELPGLPAPTFDGATELWFDDVEGIGRVFGDPEYLAIIRPDEERFIDLLGCEFLVTVENPVHG